MLKMHACLAIDEYVEFIMGTFLYRSNAKFASNVKESLVGIFKNVEKGIFDICFDDWCKH